jgi:hypothetical protein
MISYSEQLIKTLNYNIKHKINKINLFLQTIYQKSLRLATYSTGLESFVFINSY